MRQSVIIHITSRFPRAAGSIARTLLIKNVRFAHLVKQNAVNESLASLMIFIRLFVMAPDWDIYIMLTIC